MNNKRKFVIAASILPASFIVGIFLECFFLKNDASSIQKIAKNGDDIYKVREVLVDKGFECTNIVDPFLDRESLMFTVSVRDSSTSWLDRIEYASGIGLRPWRNFMPDHVVISAFFDNHLVYETKVN